jgi:hypothetical protein
MKLSFFSLLPVVLFFGCITSPGHDSDSGAYTVSIRENTVYSFRGGGGIFVLNLEPESDFEGDVKKFRYMQTAN